MAQVGYGTKVEYKVGAGSYVELVDVLMIERPARKPAIAKYQPLRTTRHKRVKIGTYEYSDMKITMVHVAATWLTIDGLIGDETLTWKITRSDGTSTETFAGKISELSGEVKVDDIDVMIISVAVDDAVTFA